MPNFAFFFFSSIVAVQWKYPCGVQAPGKLFALQLPHFWSKRIHGDFEMKGARCRVNDLQDPGTSKYRDELGVGEKKGVWKGAYEPSHLSRHFMGSIMHKLSGTRQPGFCCSPMQNLCK